MHTTQTVKSSLPQLPPSVKTDTMAVTHLFQNLCQHILHDNGYAFIQFTYRQKSEILNSCI